MILGDRIAAAESIVEAEDRQRSPVWKAVELAVDLFPGPVKVVIKAFGGLQARRIENLGYFHQVLRDQVHDLEEKFDNMNEAQKQFYQQEFPALLIDAHFKVETLRSKTKIERIARILTRSYKEGRNTPLDHSEEMMRVATALDDDDVEVLRQIVATQRDSLGRDGSVGMGTANNSWKNHPPTINGLTPATITSICLKLESFGLITRVEREPMKIGPTSTGLPFALLSKGLDFVRFATGNGSV